ncbi:protein of unknown function [Saccharicrinis carchari]|uniref:DUF4286 domain-containing protein n=1 Tax=Saccharicrinis carchari TaxID=1168039 RepID=A0A521ELH7_SACCC|nr:DUF4286 family protein [Saccharicrinis carchari]SMO84311.1 protein of unknown function [Saccharicrinis carchari]
MFIYNTTFVVNISSFDTWQKWLYTTCKPLIKNLVPASEVAVYEVMSIENEEERTVSVQWKVASPDDLDAINKQSPLMLKQMSSDFGEKVLFFSTILRSL